MLKKIKTITSYAKRGAFYGELDNRAKIIGYVPRQVHTPYASGPTHAVYSYKGKPIIIAEIAHKTYRVFEVDAADVRKTEAEIERAMMRKAPPLPGAESVRDNEIPTPEFTAEFTLTRAVVSGPKPKQPTLFEED